MKKIFLFLTLITLSQDLFAQGVGINTTSPDPSAALDIQSTNKGILIPKVALQSLTDKTTIVDPANSLMVYNTNPSLKYGIGYYFNANTPNLPDWRFLSSVAMPYYYAGSQAEAIFQIENYNGGFGPIAIKGYSAGSGVGVHAKSDIGNAIVAEGGVKIFGGNTNPGKGKVLTSNDIGEASWEGAVAFSAVGVLGGGNAVVDKGVNFKIPFASQEYDLNSNYDNVAHIFTAPKDGIYHFNSQLVWGAPEPVTGTFSLVRLRSGNQTIQRTNLETGIGGISIISCDIKLQKDDVVFMIFSHTQDLNVYLNTDPMLSYFSGRLVITQ